MVQCSFTSTETRRLVRTDSPGRPPRLSHSYVLSSPHPPTHIHIRAGKSLPGFLRQSGKPVRMQIKETTRRLLPNLEQALSRLGDQRRGIEVTRFFISSFSLRFSLSAACTRESSPRHKTVPKWPQSLHEKSITSRSSPFPADL